MGLVQLIILVLLIICVGQIYFYKTKKFRNFLIAHIVSIIIVLFFSIIISMNQTGGVRFPWWFFAVYPSAPLVISLLLGYFIYFVRSRRETF